MARRVRLPLTLEEGRWERSQVRQQLRRRMPCSPPQEGVRFHKAIPLVDRLNWVSAMRIEALVHHGFRFLRPSLLWNVTKPLGVQLQGRSRVAPTPRIMALIKIFLP